VQNAELFDALRDGGGFATVRAFRTDPPRGITMHEIWVRDYFKETAKLDRLREQVEAGELMLRVARTLPLDQAADAHRLLAKGGVRGRLVLEV
jgi:NADPH:quinone reductase